MRILITGTAGFIGFHTAKRLLQEGHEITGIDNFNDYYDVNLKEARNKILEQQGRYGQFMLLRANIADKEKVAEVFKTRKPEVICNLAAQAGVRYSIENPYAYGNSNLDGFLTILNEARNAEIDKIVYASSSSVYGDNCQAPFKEDAVINKPLSLYAATKAANELLAYSYYNTFGIKSMGLRFFTVYGPMGRPDMAMFKFAKSIFEKKPVDVYNNGDLKRDFTYIDDIVEGVIRAIMADFDYEIVNLGNSHPEKVSTVIDLIEKYIGEPCIRNFKPAPPTEVAMTYADTSKAERLLGFKPNTPIEEGIKRFIEWYRGYYGGSKS